MIVPLVRPPSLQSAMATFTTTLVQMGNNVGIEVPEDVVLGFGAGRRVPVTVHLNGHVYASTIARMGGRFLIPVSKAVREAAGVAGGEQHEITLEHDTSSRTPDVPTTSPKHWHLRACGPRSTRSRRAAPRSTCARSSRPRLRRRERGAWRRSSTHCAEAAAARPTGPRLREKREPPVGIEPTTFSLRERPANR